MLVEVPDDVKEKWLSANKLKWKCNPLLPRVDTKAMWLATIKNTHFVHAQKLVAEGGRTYKNMKDGKPLKLKEGDTEGKLIQKHGVTALLYTKELWKDKPALLALMREDNANADTNLAETELDAFGTVNAVIIEMPATSEGSGATVITADGVMGKSGSLVMGTSRYRSG